LEGEELVEAIRDRLLRTTQLQVVSPETVDHLPRLEIPTGNDIKLRRTVPLGLRDAKVRR
jgi:hypothetical protein